MKMPLATYYRYRTRALIGPWRSTREEALADAIGARQVAVEPGPPMSIRWLVPGEIEESDEPEPPPAEEDAD